MAKTISREMGCWIQYQLKLNRIEHKEVALFAGVSGEMVSQFLRGRKDSARVRTALCKVLGYATFEALAAASRGHVPADGSAKRQKKEGAA